MVCGVDRQAGSSVRVQRRRNSVLSHDESPIRHAPSAVDRVRAKLVAAGRPLLERAGFQHSLPPPEDAERRHRLSRRDGPFAPADRRDRDQSGG